MVCVQHKAAVFGDVFLPGDHQLYIAAGDGVLQDKLNVAVFFNFRIVVGVFGVFAELEPGTGDDGQVFQHHGNDSIHVGFLSGGGAAWVFGYHITVSREIQFIFESAVHSGRNCAAVGKINKKSVKVWLT